MGLLGFGLSILGKAVIGEAIRQGMEEQRREEEEKARIYNKFHPMSDEELFEYIWDNRFTYSSDTGGALIEIDNRGKSRYDGENYYIIKLADYLDNNRDYYKYHWEDENGEQLSEKAAEIEIVKCINELYEEAGKPVPYQITYEDESFNDMLGATLGLMLGSFIVGKDQLKREQLFKKYDETNVEHMIIKRIN